MWFMEISESIDVPNLVASIYRRGVIVSFTRQLIRVLPPATIRPERLAAACRIVREEILKAADG